ncbi:armadillo-type protein [Syncephalis fuscata]|nr:armadillo-type protein [Syncephalis fuscata]
MAMLNNKIPQNVQRLILAEQEALLDVVYQHGVGLVKANVWQSLLRKALLDYQVAIERVFHYEEQQLPISSGHSDQTIIFTDQFFTMTCLPLNTILSLGFDAVQSLDCIAITFRCLARLMHKRLSATLNETALLALVTFHVEHWYRMLILLASYGQKLHELPIDTVSASHEEAILAFLDCLQACLPSNSDMPPYWRERAQQVARDPTRFYAPLGIFTLITGEWMTSSINWDIRLAATDVLESLLVGLVDDARLLASVAPKVLGKLAVHIQKTQAGEHRRPLKHMLQLTQHLVIAVFADTRQMDWRPVELNTVADITQLKNTYTKRQQQNIKSEPIKEEMVQTMQGTFPLIVRNADWIKTTTPKLQKALEAILSVRFHTDTAIRMACMQLASQIIQSCSHTLSDIIPGLLDVILIYADDEQQQIREVWLQTIDELKQHPDVHKQLPKALSSRLKDGLARLPDLLLLREGQPKRALQQETSTFTSAITQPNIELIDDALMDQSNSNVNSTTFTYIDTDTALARLFKRLGAVGDVEMLLDHFMQLLQTSELNTYHPQCALVVGWLLEGASALSPNYSEQKMYFNLDSKKSDELVPALAEAILQDIMEIHTSLESTRYKGSSNSSSLYQEQIAPLTVACLHVVTVCARIIASDQLQILLVDLLYPLCEQLASSVAMVRHAASNALRTIAIATGCTSVYHLLLGNVDYMMNAVSLRLRHLPTYPQTPAMLSAVVKVTGKAILPYMGDVLEDLVDGLEEYYIENDELRGQLVHTLSELARAMSLSSPCIEFPLLEEKQTEPTLEKHIRYNQPSVAVQVFLHQTRTFGKTEVVNQDLELVKKDGAETADSSTLITTNNEIESASESAEKRILSLKADYAERILSSLQNHATMPNTNDRVNVLEAVVACTLVLSNDRRRLDPLVKQIWPLIIENLSNQRQMNEPLVVKLAAARAVAIICKTCESFMALPFSKDAWPLLEKWLLHRDHSSRTEWTLASTALSVCTMVIPYLDAIVTWKLLQMSLPWLVNIAPESSISKDQINRQVEQLYSRIISYHPNLVWLTLYTALPPLSIEGTENNPLNWPPNQSKRFSAYLKLNNTPSAPIIDAMLRLKDQLE